MKKWNEWPGALKGTVFVLIFYFLFIGYFGFGLLTCKEAECAVGGLLFFFLLLILIGLSPIIIGLGALFGHLLSKPKKEQIIKEKQNIKISKNYQQEKRFWFDWPGWVKAIIFLLFAYLINLILYIMLKVEIIHPAIFDIVTAIIMPFITTIIFIYGIISFIIWIKEK